MFEVHYLSTLVPFHPSCWLSLTLISLILFALIYLLVPSSCPLVHHITFHIFSLTSSSLSFPLLSVPPLSPHSSSPRLLSHLPSLFHLCFSSPVLSSPWPSVYPIWPSHLSWELSQGTRLLIQFLLNLTALSSAFAIPATCREAKQNKKGQRSTKTCLDPPKKLSLDD